MANNSNAAVVRTMVEAFGRGDLETVGATFSPDAVWDLPGTSAVAGTYKGPDEIVGFLAKSYELSGGTLSVEVIDILGSDNGAAQLQRVTATADGRRLDCVEALIHEMVDGKIVRTYHRPDQYAIDAFFGA